jgi:hypothetical protein
MTSKAKRGPALAAPRASLYLSSQCCLGRRAQAATAHNRRATVK